MSNRSRWIMTCGLVGNYRHVKTGLWHSVAGLFLTQVSLESLRTTQAKSSLLQATKGRLPMLRATLSSSRAEGEDVLGR